MTIMYIVFVDEQSTCRSGAIFLFRNNRCRGCDCEVDGVLSAMHALRTWSTASKRGSPLEVVSVDRHHLWPCSQVTAVV